ncbi:MAG: hypothetical protein QOH99_1565, partial [Frankiaceae bacterium]|nr:hypothetical protein [Frankiaceae bacterium]
PTTMADLQLPDADPARDVGASR